MSKPSYPALARLAIVLAFTLPAPVMAWGKTGHRVIATIAERYLSSTARKEIAGILGVETIAEASNWPDFMRSDPSAFWQQTASPWHYVTVPTGKTYAEVGAPPEGDAVTALQSFSTTVASPSASRTDKQLALRFIIHIVGDLHQPLHAGNGTDKGGNDIRVTFNGRPTNLHALWDSGLVDEEQLSYSEMSAWLARRTTRTNAMAWGNAEPIVWIAESAALRDRIYPAAGETALGYAYIFQHQREVEDRLAQGGVRLAAYLNQLFARQH